MSLARTRSLRVLESSTETDWHLSTGSNGTVADGDSHALRSLMLHVATMLRESGGSHNTTGGSTLTSAQLGQIQEGQLHNRVI